VILIVLNDMCDMSPVDSRMIWPYSVGMDSRDTFMVELRKKRVELANELGALRNEQNRISADIADVVERLNHILALIRAEEGRKPGEPVPIPGEPRWKEVSVPEAVFALLREYGGGPLHADVIRNMLEEKGRKVGKDNVVTALVRAQRRGQVERVAPNTFRLKGVDGMDLVEDGE